MAEHVRATCNYIDFDNTKITANIELRAIRIARESSIRETTAVQQHEHTKWHPNSTNHVKTLPERNQEQEINIKRNVNNTTNYTSQRPTEWNRRTSV